MVEKTVKICDECKKQLASNSCAICGAKDVCARCSNRLGLNIVLDTSKYYFERTKVPLCRQCCMNLDELEQHEKNEVLKNVSDEAVRLLKRMFIINGLDGRTRRKKK